MARYIDADALLMNLPSDLPYKASVKRVLMQAPTAEVTSDSEVERLKRILDSYAFQCGTVTDKQAIINHERAEVAKEIFEEIEFDIHQLMFEREEHRAIAIEGVIAELKKKYTEEHQ